MLADENYAKQHLSRQFNPVSALKPYPGEFLQIFLPLPLKNVKRIAYADDITLTTLEPQHIDLVYDKK